MMNKLVPQNPGKLIKQCWNGLDGLFAVYKQSGLTPGKIVRMVQDSVLRDLNSLPEPPPKTLVRIIPDEARLDYNPTALTAAPFPSLADHPLVRGPKFTKLKVVRIPCGHDLRSSGVMGKAFVLAMKSGTRKIDFYNAARFPRVYVVNGILGIATRSHDIEGRVIEKSTYDHVTLSKMERIVEGIARSHQKSVLTYSGVDMHTQEAYELAVRGLLQPTGDIPPLILDIRCTKFEPPNFELEVQCVRESAQFLRKLLNDIGLFLKSNAVCSKVRRVQDGPFVLDQALLRNDWHLQPVLNAIKASRPQMKLRNLIPVDKRKDAVLVQEKIKDRIHVIEGAYSNVPPIT